MNLRAFRDATLRDVNRFDRDLVAAHEREAALVPFESMRSLLASDTEIGHENERNIPVVMALLREYQRGGSEAWGAALLVAMYPMLAAMRRKVRVPHTMVDDVDASMAHAFLEEAGRINTDAFCTLASLRRATERAVHATVKEWISAARVAREYQRAAYEPHAAPDLALFLDLMRSANNGVAPLQSTSSLRKEIESTSAHVPNLDRKRLYERLKKQKSRARARLRAELAIAA